MANTNIKAGMFHGVIGNGPNGYFLKTNGDGSMTWDEAGTPSPTVTSVTYPGDDTAADPAGGQSVTLTGTNFVTGATVTIGGTTAPTVSFVSATELTITTPAKAAGDYDVVVTNTDGGTATFVDGISYNGIPAWTTASGSLGTFASNTTISTITLQASEPDAGTITFNITSGALPTGLSLTGADIDGTTSKETADTLYNFTVTAIDDENQSTPRAFSITVEKYIVPAPENFEIVTYTGNGGTQAITSKIGKAASFNGSSSKIDTSLTLDTNTVNGGSISLWFKTSQTTPVQILLGSQSARGGASYGTSILLGSATSSSDQESFTIWDYDGGTTSMFYTEGGSTFYQDGEWHHLVITSTSTTKNIYIDGVPQTVSYSSSGSASANLKFTDIQIGANLGYTDTRYFDGLIDQVRIFDKAISSSEVTTLYNETYASSTKSTTDIFGDGSGVALYELDEDANDTGRGAIDSGQSGNFDSSDSRIENVYQINYNNSISMWLNVDNTIPLNTYYGLWTQGDGTAAYAGIRYKRNSGDNYTIEAFIRLGNDYIYRRNTSSTWSPGWNHFVFLVNSTTGFDFYLNGNNGNFSNWFVAGTFTNVDFSNKTAIIGKYTTGTTTFKGQIDDVRFYSDLLTTTEIGYLANNDTTNISTISNFAAHYKLDGNANDSIGSNNGTWIGTEAYSDPALLPPYNGTPTNVNFLGMAFQPDLVWLKSRSATWEHFLQDSVRGAANYLRSNSTGAEGTTVPNIVSSFDANGFTLLSNGNSNNNNDTYVAWCWKAADTTTTIAANTVGNTIASDVRANTDAGFSIVKYTGNNTAGATVGHGLSSAPEMIIIKNLENTVAARNWAVYHSGVDANPENYFLRLNSTIAKLDYDIWNDTAPTSTVFSLGNTTNVGEANDNNNDHIAYCFHSVDGYQSVGSYTGTGLAGNTVTTGFEPRFVMIKSSSNAEPWFILDAARDATNPRDNRLMADSSAAEDDGSVHTVDFTSTGFTANGTVGNGTNGSGITYIYLAIA